MNNKYSYKVLINQLYFAKKLKRGCEILERSQFIKFEPIPIEKKLISVRIIFKLKIYKSSAVYSEQLICIIKFVNEQTILKLNNL